jgi:hypothetical protein
MRSLKSPALLRRDPAWIGTPLGMGSPPANNEFGHIDPAATKEIAIAASLSRRNHRSSFWDAKYIITQPSDDTHITLEQGDHEQPKTGRRV